MIRIPLLNKVIRSKVITNEFKSSLKALGQTIDSMSKDPKWKAFIDKANKEGISEDDEQYFNNEFEKDSQDGRGRSEI